MVPAAPRVQVAAAAGPANAAATAVAMIENAVLRMLMHSE
ncbi:Hypothetical protein I596_366 [Dokdonella koreensis DS-123]|uniref:Uncharacterized protein n=1 Tax=Dokdonella koreensis DS-123 TaxID=1300342 RepID=A0A167GCE2_9GAMM|nr:Hypothetical protein I596_366 [Dokdonella koreensis DS-123]